MYPFSSKGERKKITKKEIHIKAIKKRHFIPLNMMERTGYLAYDLTYQSALQLYQHANERVLTRLQLQHKEHHALTDEFRENNNKFPVLIYHAISYRYTRRINV